MLHEWWINKLKDTPLARDHGAIEASFCNNSFMQQHNIISTYNNNVPQIWEKMKNDVFLPVRKKRNKDTWLISMHNGMVHFAKQRR